MIGGNKMKKFKIITSVFLFTLFTCTLGACYTSKAANPTYFVSVSINPEIGLIANENGKVLDVITLNGDADVLVSDMDLEGKGIDEAVAEIVDDSVEAGYIDANTEGKEVLVSVDGEDERKTISLFEKIESKVNNYFKNKGIFGKVSEATITDYLEDAALVSQSVGRVKMILLALELHPDLTVQELKDNSTQELVKLIHDSVKKENLGHTINQERKEKIKTLKQEYAELFLLKEQNDELYNQLENAELTEEEKSEIGLKIQENEQKIAVLETEYDQKLEEIKLEFKNKKEEYKTYWKEQKQNKINSNKNKNQSHNQEVEQNIQMTEDIINYQNN